MFRRVFVSIKYIVYEILLRINRIFPVKNNKVVFMSYYGEKYSDNPRFISEALENKNLEIVWIVPFKIKEGIRTVTKRSLRTFYELATAKVWVDNCRKPVWCKKRNSQYYIQTWHGGVCIKSVEADAEDTLDEIYLKNAKYDSTIADLFVSECKWRDENYRNAFWYNGEILKCGLPSSDVFYKNASIIKNKVYDFYNLEDNVRIILYAPTFRDSHSIDVYNIDTEKVLKSVKEKYGGEWVLLFRLHPNVDRLQNKIKYSDRVINGSKYNEMNELLVASEILITDYSGCLFDGLHFKKKVFIFASDIEDYVRTNRMLYFDLRNLPSPLAVNNTELINNIMNFDDILYEDKRSRFVDKLGYYECNNASKLVADRILKIIEFKNGG